MENKKLNQLLEAIKAKRKAKEHTPVVANKDLENGKKAEELKAPLIEAKKLPEALKKNMHDDPKDADKVPEKLEKKALKEEGEAAAQPVATSDSPAKEHTPVADNKDVLKGQHAEEVKEVIVEENQEAIDEISQDHKDELADKGELDYEGDMALSQLRTIIDAAVELNDMLEGNEDANLPEWVQSKMTLAKEYIDTVRDYLKSEKQESDEESFSKEEIVEVMEALKLDTNKYTFEYLAEQLGFVPLKEEELGDAAAKPVHDQSEKAVEHKPEVKQDEVHAGEQKAEEVKAPLIEAKKLGSAAAKPVHGGNKAVAHKPVASNKDIVKGQHAEEVKSVIVEAAKVKKAPLKVKITPKKNVVIDKKGQLSQAAPSVTPAAAVVAPAAKAGK
jgi:hypothetical protein